MTNMFNSKKKKKEQEQNKVNVFIAEYKTLAHKYGLDFYASLQVTDKGIIPVIKIRVIPNEAGGS